MAISFVTTTTYGTWLPGDLRGFVRRGVILPGDPELLEQSRRLLKGTPVLLSTAERDVVFEALVAGGFGRRDIVRSGLRMKRRLLRFRSTLRGMRGAG